MVNTKKSEVSRLSFLIKLLLKYTLVSMVWCLKIIHSTLWQERSLNFFYKWKEKKKIQWMILVKIKCSHFLSHNFNLRCFCSAWTPKNKHVLSRKFLSTKTSYPESFSFFCLCCTQYCSSLPAPRDSPRGRCQVVAQWSHTITTWQPLACYRVKWKHFSVNTG